MLHKKVRFIKVEFIIYQRITCFRMTKSIYKRNKLGLSCAKLRIVELKIEKNFKETAEQLPLVRLGELCSSCVISVHATHDEAWVPTAI